MGPDANNRSYISLTRSQTDRPNDRPSDPHYGAQTYGARSGQLLTVMLDASGVRTVDERELTNVSKSLGVSYVHVRPRS